MPRTSVPALVGFLTALVMLAAAPIAVAETREELFKAAEFDDEGAIVTMVLKGLNVGAQDEQGQSALLIAVTGGSTKAARFLMKQPTVKVNARNAKDESALMMAAIKGRLEIAKDLIAAGADVNKPGWTPLHYACSNPEPESRSMVDLLLEKYAYIDAESPNKTTPLMMAARYGHIDVVKRLLEEGADAGLHNQQGMTALDFAVSADRAEVAMLIGSFTRPRNSTGRW